MWILYQQKTLVIDSDTERKRKLTILENAPLLLQKTGLKTTFHKNQKTKDVLGNSTKC